MKVILPSYSIMLLGGQKFDRQFALQMLRHLEDSGRTCYKSEGAATPTSAPEFVRKIAKVVKHESVLEHCYFTVRFICDRGVTHELVRHRLAAFSQESTRYCNYSKDKFGNEITVIKPCFWDERSPEYTRWEKACLEAEKNYFGLLACGRSAQEARSVLPNSLKTEIVMTANLREWLHVFKLRTSDKAHPQMREIMIPLRDHCVQVMPEIFANDDE